MRDLGAAAVEDFLHNVSVAIRILGAAIEHEIDSYAVAGVTRRAYRAFAIRSLALVAQIAFYTFAWEPLRYKGS